MTERPNAVCTKLSPDLYRRFTARVATEQLTPSSLLRRALEQYLTQAETIVSPGRSWELEDDDQGSSDIRRSEKPITGTGTDTT